MAKIKNGSEGDLRGLISIFLRNMSEFDGNLDVKLE